MDDEIEDQGLRPIGSLAAQMLPSLKSTDLQTDRSRGSQTSSAITGAQLPARQQSNSTGLQLGGTAYELWQSAGPNKEGITPDLIDKAMDRPWLPRCVATCIERRESPIIDPEYGFDGVVTHYTPLTKVEARDAEAYQMVLRQMEAINEPSPPPLITFELGRLRVMTKAKAEDQDSLDFLIACFAEDMREYPADVVREACRKWSRTEKFFPSWSELKALLDRMVKRRRSMLYALRAVRPA